jgi:hypothetical protein
MQVLPDAQRSIYDGRGANKSMFHDFKKILFQQLKKSCNHGKIQSILQHGYF